MSTKGASLASTTRLSPLAKPFELNRSNHQPTSSFSVLSPDYCCSDPFASLLEPLYKLKVGSKVDPVVSAPLVDYGFGDEISHASFPDEAAVQYPSVEFQESGEFVVLDESKFDMISDAGLGFVASSGNKHSYWTEGADYFENLSGKGENVDNSVADRDMLNKGKNAVDGLSPCLGASNGAFGKDTGTIAANDILSKSKVTRQADAGSSLFLTSSYEVSLSIFATSDISSPAKLKNTLQNQYSLFPSIVTDSNLVSTGTSDWQYFPSCLSNDVSNSTENHSAGFHGSSSSGLSLSRLKVCSANPNDVKSESRDTLAGVSTETPSKPSGGDDSDLDSPCWKGRLASSQCPSEIPGPGTSQHSHKELEKHTSLNPLAPQFFPSNVGGNTFNGLGCIKDGFVSSQSSAPLSFNKGMKTTTVEAHPLDLKKETELQCSSNLFEREKESDLIDNPKSSSVLSSPCMNQSCSFEHHSLLKRSPVTTADIEDCTKGAKEALASGSFPAKGHSTTPSSSTSRVGVITDPFKIFQDVSKSSIESPELDVQRIVNAMYVLSELLVQTRAKGLDSYNEHDHNIILQIINMLNAFSKNYGGQRVPTLESTHTGSPYCDDWSTELPKPFNNGFEVTSMEALAVPNNLYHKNDNEGRSSVSKVVAEKALYSFSDAEKAKDIIVQPFYKGFEVTSMKPMTVPNELDHQNDNEEQTSVSKVVAEKGWHPFSSSSGIGSEKANEIVQPSNKGFALTSMEPLTVPLSIYHQNDYEGQSNVSKVVAGKAWHSFPSSSGVSAEKANEIVQLQVIRRGLGKSQDAEEQTDPQALLFRNLWLDCEAERCFMKYKAYCRLMETGVDVNRTNIMDLWR